VVTDGDMVRREIREGERKREGRLDFKITILSLPKCKMELVLIGEKGKVGDVIRGTASLNRKSPTQQSFTTVCYGA
jgi:hypothetical protein